MGRREVIDRKRLEEIVGGPSSNPHKEALVSFLYLTGARISEALQVKKSDIRIRDDIFLVDIVILKRRRKKQLVRTLGIPIKEGGIFIEVILNYVNTYCRGEILFPFSRKSGYNYVKKLTGTHPHILRHSRLTHLVQDYDFDVTQLVQFTGWKTWQTGEDYIHLKWRDVTKKLQK